MHIRYLKRLLLRVIRLPTINLVHCQSNEPCHHQVTMTVINIYIYKVSERELHISSSVVVVPVVMKRKYFY